MILPHPSPDPKMYREKKDRALTEMCSFSTVFFIIITFSKQHGACQNNPEHQKINNC